MRKISFEDFVNDVDYEDENVYNCDGIIVVIAVVAMMVKVTMLPTWRQQGIEHLAKM